ncbi:MAG TPA: SDR family NAD(P)-dependent oxidoreductase [Terriglobia bacterium]|nr:SDR family NAD(P)-dependent oxidoreductase [Terriglobia bacterium]
MKPSGSLEGKSALVTGASRGIGRAVAVRLAAEGAELVLHCNKNRSPLEDLAASLPRPSTIAQANMAELSEIRRMFESLAGRALDILVNNAGIWRPTPIEGTAPEALDELVAVNLKSVFWVTQSALPLLKPGARIVNISSVAARLGVAGRSVYGATKAAVESLTRSLALELAPRKILVNAVAPGYVETDMTAEHFSNPAVLERALKRHPLGRLGVPEDVADVVAFLCSRDARFITGQVINVSGGFII